MLRESLESAVTAHFERDWDRVEVSHDILSEDLVITLRVSSSALDVARKHERHLLSGEHERNRLMAIKVLQDALNDPTIWNQTDPPGVKLDEATYDPMTERITMNMTIPTLLAPAAASSTAAKEARCPLATCAAVNSTPLMRSARRARSSNWSSAGKSKPRRTCSNRRRSWRGLVTSRAL